MDSTKRIALNFPPYEFRTTIQNGSEFIFDRNRKKYVPLTPEEWVRQNLMSYLVEYQHIPIGLIGIEVSFTFNEVKHRADLIVYSKNGLPLLLAECKAPEVNITNAVIEQVARYNYTLNAEYMLVTNGLAHYIFRNNTKGEWDILSDFPNLTEKL